MHRLFQRSRSWLLLSSVSCALTACGSNTAGQIDPISAPLENGIIDGTRSTEKDYPATGVILFTTERDDGSEFGSMLCSGTLVAPDVVMAAGHCDLSLFLDLEAPIKYYFSLALDVADFGEYSIDLPEKTVGIAELVPHPDFSLYRVNPGLSHADDIALLYLDEAIDWVKPAKLVRRNEVSKIKEGAEVAIVGYGRRHEDASLDSRSDSGLKFHGTTRINEVARYEMQISPGSPDPHKCHGDSGGPTYMKFGRGKSAHLALVGITSHAYDEEDCLHGGVDTRIDPYLDWIESTLKAACEDGTRPACKS